MDPYSVAPRVPKVHPEYTYADQDPIRRMDPFGLQSQTQSSCQDRACCIKCLFKKAQNTNAGVEHGATLVCGGGCDYKGSGTPTHVDIPVTPGKDCDQLHTHPSCTDPSPADCDNATETGVPSIVIKSCGQARNFPVAYICNPGDHKGRPLEPEEGGTKCTRSDPCEGSTGFK